MSSELDPEVLRSFMEEARSYLPALRTELTRLRGNSGAAEPLEEMHRLAHSIRGAGQMVGLKDLAGIASGLEEMLALAMSGGTACDESLLDVLDAGVQEMESVLAGPGAPVEEAEPEIQPEDIPSDLLDSFLEEAEEHLQIIGGRLQQARNKPQDSAPLIREIRRSVHTIKGAAGMVGLNDIKKLAHRMEDLLDALFENRADLTQDCYHLLASTYDTLSDMVAARGHTLKFRARMNDLFSLYQALLASPTEVMAPAPQAEEVPAPAVDAGSDPEPSDPGLFVRVPFARLDALVRLVGELFVNSSVFEQHLDGYEREMDEMDLNQARMRRIAGSLDNRCATFNPGLAGPAFSDPRRSEFDALEFDRYTELHLLSRDLNEAASDLATISGQLKLVKSSFEAFLTRQGRLGGELQDKLMRLRMVAFATLANRLHRTVRVSARKVEKDVELILEGVSTELDKAVMEQLAGPLDHLLRNAVGHGIESAAVRRAAGKPERGTIRISAGYEGTQVVVRLRDDGAGLNFRNIRNAAVRLGYYTEAEAAELSPVQLQSLIFEPGFSTAESISEISGRGVGLDVVKVGIEALKGTVSLDSQEGQGVSFTVRLPMTLVITKVLMVEAQQERYAIPLAAVTRTTRIDSGSIENCGQGRMIQLENHVLPVVQLGEWLGLRGSGELPEGRLPLVTVRAGGGEVALLVDRIMEAREVMVKPLEGLLRGVSRMVGATILGDGSVVLILNPAELTSDQLERVKRPTRKHNGARRGALEILIVDDSPSVRRAVANLVRSAGWLPSQAKDGVEALEILQRGERLPDAILMDIEMPRMDGFELTSTLRAQPQLSEIPVIMLTSRSGEKHRRKALEVGVTEYLVKPFQEDALLEAVRRCAEPSHRAPQVA